MNALRQLLQTPDSLLGSLGRVGLWAVRESLAVAAERVRTDPAAAVAGQAVRELEELLGAPAAGPSAPAPPAAVPVAPAGVVELLADWEADAALRRWLGNDQGLGRDDPKRRLRRLEMCLLRLPSSMANAWLRRLANFQDPPFASLADLAEHLFSSSQEDLPSRPVDTPWWKQMAALVQRCQRAAQADEALRRARSFGLRPLDVQEREDFGRELRDRWNRLGSANDPRTVLRAAVVLDECLQALVYVPLAAPDSWWGRQRQAAHDLLLQMAQQVRDAGVDAQIRPLWGRYGEIAQYTEADCDLALADPGRAGDILACLRVWLRIESQVWPGRVVYCSA